MPITFAETKTAGKGSQQAIDTFRRSSPMPDRLTFCNRISPGTGGSAPACRDIPRRAPGIAAVCR